MKGILLTLLTALLLTVAPLVASAGSAVSEMATIMINLNHYPTSAEKEKLAAIIADSGSTAGERVIAGALMRMQHRVGGSDAEQLMKLESDETAPKEERELAAILRGIAHHPSKPDIGRLKAISE